MSHAFASQEPGRHKQQQQQRWLHPRGRPYWLQVRRYSIHKSSDVFRYLQLRHWQPLLQCQRWKCAAEEEEQEQAQEQEQEQEQEQGAVAGAPLLS